MGLQSNNVRQNIQNVVNLLTNVAGRSATASCMLDSWGLFDDVASEAAWRAAAANRGNTDPAVEDVLTEMVSCNLLQRKEISGRDYCIRQPIVGECLKDRERGLSADDRIKYEIRTIDYYTREFPLLCDSFFEFELPPLLRMLDSIMEKHADVVLAFCNMALSAENDHLMKSGPWHAATSIAQRGVRAAEQVRNIQALIAHTRYHGESLYRSAEYEKADQVYANALSREGIPWRNVDLADFARQRGQIAYRVGNLEEAERLYKEAMRYAEDARQPELVDDVRHQLGKVHYRRGNFEHAAKVFGQVYKGRSARGDVKGTAKTLHEIARVHHAQHRFDAALDVYNDCLQRRRDAKDPIGEAATQYQLGLLAVDLDDAGIAREHLEACRSLAERHVDWFWRAHCPFLEARILWLEGQCDDAFKMAEDAARLSHKYRMSMEQEVLDWIRWARGERKMSKARCYAADPSRFEFHGETCMFRSDHGPRRLLREKKGWGCDCQYYAKYQICSHALALKMFEEAVPADAGGDRHD